MIYPFNNSLPYQNKQVIWLCYKCFMYVYCYLSDQKWQRNLIKKVEMNKVDGLKESVICMYIPSIIFN